MTERIVNRYQIIGTRLWVYEVLEPVDGHTFMTTRNGQTYGLVGSRRLPANLESLPAWSAERAEAVRAHMDAEYAAAYELIYAEYGEAKFGRHSMGRIELLA